MKTIIENKNLKVVCAGSSNTYFVLDSANQLRLVTSSKTKALNAYNRINKDSNYN